MQECFRKHPDIYGSELDDDEEDDEAAAQADHQQPDAQQGGEEPSKIPMSARTGDAKEEPAQETGHNAAREETLNSSKIEKTKPTARPSNDQIKAANKAEEESIPKVWHDTRDAETQKQ